MPRRKKGPGDRSTHQTGGLGIIQKEKPQQRNAANARERARMRVLSRAFYRLKTALSWVPPDTKLSKLDTLRMASKHIAGLKAALESDDPLTSTEYFYPPVTMTWPYGLSKGPGGCGLVAGSDEGEDDSVGGLGDDSESLSCVSASSWEESTKNEMTPITQQLARERSHLDGHDNLVNHSVDLPPTTTSYHHAHLLNTFHNQNAIY